MTEPKPKKEILKKTKLIIKWLGQVLLSFLIILALISGAPWKVTTLLVIFLLACTILPKAYRKWFWLSVGVILITLIIWVFLPDDSKDWQPYKHKIDKELAALETKYALTDEENAAIIYNKLLQDYDEDTFYTNLSENELYKLPMREPWLSKDHPEITEWLKAHRNIIDVLIKASEIERCRFSISDPNYFEKQVSRNAAMRHWAFLLVSAANNDIAEGRIEEGFQKNFALLQMGKHMRRQPYTIDWLVGITVEALGIGQFKTFIVTGENATEKHLSSIEKVLTNIESDWNKDFLKILESDKMSTKKEFGRFYEINPKGRTRISRDPFKEHREYCRKLLENEEIEMEQYRSAIERFAYPSYFDRKLVRAQTILFWFYLPSSPQKVDKIIDAVYQDYYKMAKPDFDWSKKPREFEPPRFKFRLNCHRTIELLSGASEKNYHTIHDIHLRHQIETKASRLIIALRRYKNRTGRWPENLDEIKPLAPAEIFVDPINGNSFVYKPADDNFILYSKGANNIDNNGRFDVWREYTGVDDWLIWPRELPETQEKKADDEQQ